MNGEKIAGLARILSHVVCAEHCHNQVKQAMGNCIAAMPPTFFCDKEIVDFVTAANQLTTEIVNVENRIKRMIDEEITNNGCAKKK